MAQEKMRMPMTEAGLVRYSDENTSRFVIKPAVVIGLGIAIIVVAIALHILF